MTKDEALKMAIEYIDKLKTTGQTNWLEINVIQNACKEALEQRDLYSEIKEGFDALKQPAQEPVAWMNDISYSDEVDNLPANRGDIIPLYAHPAPSWQGLSDDEISKVISDEQIPVRTGKTANRFAHAIEQALKEKNG